MKGDLGMALRCKISRMNESDVDSMDQKGLNFLSYFQLKKFLIYM